MVRCVNEVFIPLPTCIRVINLDSVGHVLNTNCASWHDFVVYFHSLIVPGARAARDLLTRSDRCANGTVPVCKLARRLNR